MDEICIPSGGKGQVGSKIQTRDFRSALYTQEEVGEPVTFDWDSRAILFGSPPLHNFVLESLLSLFSRLKLSHFGYWRFNSPLVPYIYCEIP